MKKLMKRKNNKGFSLVELIVVVLIMGIIAVALAPQVMKWVGESRKSSDKNNANSLKSSIQVALADWQQDYPLPGSGVTASATVNGGNSIALSAAGGTWANLSDLITEIDTVTAGDYPKTQNDTSGFLVTIDGATGKVTVTCSATSN